MRLLPVSIRSLVFFLLSIVTISFSQHLFADNKTLDRINQSGEIVIGMSGEQPPFNFMVSNGETIGFDVDIAMKLGQALDKNVRISNMPFSELQDALKSGKIDIIMSGFSITPERSNYFNFVGPYALTGKSIVTTKETLKRIKQTTGFNHEDIRLVALQNSTSMTLAETRLKKASLKPVAHYEDALLAILAGEADALVADLTICELLVIRDVNSSLATLNKPLAIEEIGIAINKNEAQLETQLREHLHQLASAGELKKFHSKWFDDPGWLALLP